MRTLGDEWRKRLLKVWLISRPDKQGSRKLVYMTDIESEYSKYAKKYYHYLLGFYCLFAKGTKFEFKYFRVVADDFNPWMEWSYFKDKKIIKKLESKLAKIMLVSDRLVPGSAPIQVQPVF